MPTAHARLQQSLASYLPTTNGTLRTEVEVEGLRPDLVIEFPHDIRIAIEILETPQSPGDVTRRMGTYFDIGAQEVWLIDPADRMVELWTTPRFPLQLTGDDVISSVHLPGYALPLTELFA